jgi:hypothetical protein
VSECRHAEGPKGYVDWHEWAERMSKRYDNHRCPKCGLWKVWKRKEKP